MIRSFHFTADAGRTYTFHKDNFSSIRHVQQTINIDEHGRGGSGIQCKMEVDSSLGVSIDLKCFRFQPPPPKFGPCPDAGTIDLPKRLLDGWASVSFTLPVDNEPSFFDAPSRSNIKTYYLAVWDFESSVNLFIHINP